MGECWNKAFSDGGARVDKLSLSVPGRRERSDILGNRFISFYVVMSMGLDLGRGL